MNPTNPPQFPSHVDTHLEPLSHPTIHNTPFSLPINPNINPTNPQFPSPTQYNIPTHFEDEASPQANENVRALGPKTASPLDRRSNPHG